MKPPVFVLKGPKNCKMELEAGNFCRIKNKEVKNKKWLKSKEVSIEPTVGLAFGDWLTRYSMLLVKQKIYKSYLSFGMLPWQPGQEWHHLWSRNIFQQFPLLSSYWSSKKFGEKKSVFILLYSRNVHNIVNQLYSNKTFLKRLQK